MTKLHDENFYTFQYDLVKDDAFVLAPKPIEQEPDQPGGPSPWSGGTSTAGLMLRQARDSEADTKDVPQRPDPVVWDPPLANIPPNKAWPEGAQRWLDAVRRWQDGISELRRRRHNSAALAFDECQQHAIAYFHLVRKIPVAGADIRARVSNILSKVASDLDPNPQPPPNPLAQGPRTLRRMLELRRVTTTLASLHNLDWVAPVTAAANVRERPGETVSRLNANAIEVLQHIAAPQAGIDAKLQNHFYLVHQKLDYFMIVLLSVFVPLARAEMERDRRRYEAAISELDWVLADVASNATPDQFVVNEPIELRFIRLLLAECLIEQGDSEYKAETPISPLPPAPPPPARLVRHDWMQARTSYERAIAELGSLGSYAAQVTQAVAKLDVAVAAPEPDLAKLGKEILIDTIKPVLRPGEVRPAHQERMLTFRNTAATAPLLAIGEAASTDTNPRVFALLLQANARLVQLQADFNWLGYGDDYVPPWRFQFLLERGRYFAEHAKQAQRDYLNFLSTAEREELQEHSAEQAVAQESANIAIEEARVDQADYETIAARRSLALQQVVASDANRRLVDYLQFDKEMDRIFNTVGSAFALDVAENSVDYGTPTGLALNGLEKLGVPGASTVKDLYKGFTSDIGDFFSGGAVSRAKQAVADNLQRGLEIENLNRALLQADMQIDVAKSQLDVARAAEKVAMLQKEAALLRHEFAVETAAYLANRVLNAEQWFRLANSIRSVADTYLRYAIEIAFLAEQAYEFEADKQLNVIRFDYDLSELGDFLAGDFLLRDLDTLEQDLVVTQREREQYVRYVLSMTREFPEALQELRDTGRATFSMVLEQIERRFPGLILARLGAVDVVPLALLDQSRFSLRLTHQGISRMRRRPAPGADPGEPWPADPRLHAPETAIYSGLSRQDAASIFPVTTSGQRNAFEGRGAAGAWEIDMSMEENQVVPGSLADVLITFNIAGFFDANVRTEPVAPGPDVITSYISGREVFPDNFFEFSRTGKMVWPLTADLLTLSGTPGKVRNVGVLIVPARSLKQYRRYASTGLVEFTLGGDGTPIVDSGTLPPSFRFQYPDPQKPLRIGAELTAPTNVTATWDPGDGTAILAGTTFEHDYARPGIYEVTLRIVLGERLHEYLCEIALARDVLLELPLIAVPELTKEPQSPSDKRTIRARAIFPSETAPQSRTATTWHVVEAPRARRAPDDDGASDPNEAVFDLPLADVEGNRRLHLAYRAVRSQDVLFYSRQRYRRGPDQTLRMAALNVATNRRYDGAGTQPPLNAAAKHFFGDPPTAVFSPVDAWSLEFSRPENGQDGPGPFSAPGSKPANLLFDGVEIEDLVLTLEYETSPA
jgi:hypothetical protein